MLARAASCHGTLARKAQLQARNSRLNDDLVRPERLAQCLANAEAERITRRQHDASIAGPALFQLEH